jgi:rhodanese-related sulfurtransferase
LKIWLARLRFDLAILALVAGGALVIGLVSDALSGGSHHFLDNDIVSDYEIFFQKTDKGGYVALGTQFQKREFIELREFFDFLSRKRGLTIDARPEIFFRLGHIPGAISLPQGDFERRYVELKELLETDKSRPIVIYCSGYPCEAARSVRQALFELGYSNLSIFAGGWNSWTAYKLPEEIGR